jgi:YcaO-like protein with predicted kinase domain
VGHERILWLEGQDLFSGRALWVPHELVSGDFTAPLAMSAGLFEATTNGLASGNHWLEAVNHGLYEVIERDAIALWRASSAAAQDRLALDLSSVDSGPGRAMLALFAAAGVQVQVWDITSDIGLPTFLCLCSSVGLQDGVEPEFGSGCHADRDVALIRALSEAAQARLTVISGAREDVGPDGYRPEIRARRERAASEWLCVRGRRDYRRAPSCAGPTLGHDLDSTLTGLHAAGVGQAACVDLSHPDIGIPVTRVVVPSLEGPWTPEDGEYTQGARALAARTWTA